MGGIKLSPIHTPLKKWFVFCFLNFTHSLLIFRIPASFGCPDRSTLSVDVVPGRNSANKFDVFSSRNSA